MCVANIFQEFHDALLSIEKNLISNSKWNLHVYVGFKYFDIKIEQQC